MTPPSRILIIRLSSLGDILHTLPAFRSLRCAFPEAEMDWLVEREMAFLLRTVDGLAEVQVADTRSLRRAPFRPQGWRGLTQLLRRLRARRYDLALDFQGLIKTGLLAYLSGARSRFGFSAGLVRERPACWFYSTTLQAPADGLHVVQLNMALARQAGGMEVPVTGQLKVSGGEEREVADLLNRKKLSEYVIINPGGGWQTKRWKPENYGRLAERIRRDLGLPVIVTTGPGEEHLYAGMIGARAGASLHHFPVSFLHLIPLCAGARLFIGGDTGPYHLACSLGTPVVGIFGPTSPVRNGPLGTADQSVVHILPCSFCYGRTCPTQNECMDISVDEVFEAVIRRLGRERPHFQEENR